MLPFIFMHEDTWHALITHSHSYIGRPCIAFSFQFIFQEERKEKRERSSPPFAGRKSLGGKKPPYLLSFKLHSIKKRITLVRAYIPNL
jgi:hypothetical protein